MRMLEGVESRSGRATRLAYAIHNMGTKHGVVAKLLWGGQSALKAWKCAQHITKLKHCCQN